MKVSDVMTKAVVMDSSEETLAEAAARMREQQTGSLLVMDSERLLGIFTERDLLKAVASGLDPKQATIKDIMTTDLVTVEPSTTLREAAHIMASKWIRHLPVVDQEKVVGVISQRDLTGVVAQLLNEPQAEVREGQLVRERRLRRIEAGDLD